MGKGKTKHGMGSGAEGRELRHARERERGEVREREKDQDRGQKGRHTWSGRKREVQWRQVGGNGKRRRQGACLLVREGIWCPL